MNNSSRIEINAGGLGGFLSIQSLQNSFDDLQDDIDNVIDSFQAVVSDIYDLPGGVGKLGTALDELETRIRNEETKLENLEDFEDLVEEFLELVVESDKQAANKVDQNTDQFYRMNPHLKPTVRSTVSNLLDEIGNWLKDFVSDVADLFESIADFIIDAWIFGIELELLLLQKIWECVKFLGEELKEFWEEYGGLIVGIFLLKLSIAIGVIAFLAALPAALATVLACVAILSGIGVALAIGSMISSGEYGESQIGLALKNWSAGAIAGLIIGISLVGGAQIAANSIGTTAKLLLTAGNNALGGVGGNIFSQLVVEGKSFSEFDWADLGIDFCLNFVFSLGMESIKMIPIVDKGIDALGGKLGELAIKFSDATGITFSDVNAAKDIIGRSFTKFGSGFMSEASKIMIRGQFNGLGDLIYKSSLNGIFDVLWEFLPIKTKLDTGTIDPTIMLKKAVAASA